MLFQDIHTVPTTNMRETDFHLQNSMITLLW